MKKLIVLALVLGMVGSASAALYEMDLSTPVPWLTAGVANGSEPAGVSFNSDWTINGGYAEVKAFQDLGGGNWGNALDLGATDAGNGVISFDAGIIGFDTQEDVVTITARYKLIGILPSDGGPRLGISMTGSNEKSAISYYHKATYWGQSNIGMLNNNDDVRFMSADGSYTAWSTYEPWLGGLTDNDWQEISIIVDGPAGTITYSVDGVANVYNDFVDSFGNGVPVNLADATAYPRGDIRLTVNGTMQISALSIETVPEPATIALLGMGALALIRKRR